MTALFDLSGKVAIVTGGASGLGPSSMACLQAVLARASGKHVGFPYDIPEVQDVCAI
jgi:NAD(P)-dependent dehydrogenase (short-subunit alcohol dehydrogenase family)